MQLTVLTDAGGIAGRLWSEHKTGSDYSPGQLPGYASELEELGGPHRLITIVDRRDEAPEDPRWERFTWQDVAVMAWRVGRADAGPQWRTSACEAETPARQRLLHELLSYLEEEHGTVLDPISHLDVVAFARANRASDVLTAALERAAELSKLDPDGGYGWDKNDLGAYWQIFKLPGAWAAPLGGYVELHVSEDDYWANDRVGEPAFGVGFTLPERYYDELRDSSRRAWLEGVEQDGFSVAGNDQTRVYRTLYVAELISKGATLDAQAAALARWTEDSVELLQAHDPELKPVPEPPKRQNRSASDADEAAARGAPSRQIAT